jgi:hypothetical protein
MSLRQFGIGDDEYGAAGTVYVDGDPHSEASFMIVGLAQNSPDIARAHADRIYKRKVSTIL